jgi:hypothetical protein
VNVRLRERNQVLLDNPDLFLTHYFPHRLGRLEDFHLRLIQNATQRRRGLILYPAAHGKTTLVSTLLPIWALCQDPNIRIALIAKNDIDAKGIMTSIHAELAGNMELIRDFGPFRPDTDGKPWALEKLSVHKRTRRAKEPTIAAFGSGAKTVLGHRTDWTICDDVVTDKNSSTPEQRIKMREWFAQCVQTMAEGYEDRITVVGTLFDPGDLYHDLIDLTSPDSGEGLWQIQREDAIVDEEEHRTLWEDRWPWRRLMELKAEMGTLDFNKRLRNIAVDKSRMAFREEFIKGGWIGTQQFPGCLDRDYKVGDWDPSWRVVAGFDPAVGLTKSAKFCAHIVVAEGSCREHDKCRWVVDLTRDQMTLPQQADLIVAEHQRFSIGTSRVEANSYQGGLFQAIQERMEQRGVALRVEPHYTTKHNKPDPEIGVQSMSPWFERGWVHIPWGDVHSQRKMRVFVDELVQYPGRTTDTVMACWFAWRALEESAPKFQTSNYLRDKNKAFYRRRARVVLNPYYVKEEAA